MAAEDLFGAAEPAPAPAAAPELVEELFAAPRTPEKDPADMSPLELHSLSRRDRVDQEFADYMLLAEVDHPKKQADLPPTCSPLGTWAKPSELDWQTENERAARVAKAAAVVEAARLAEARRAGNAFMLDNLKSRQTALMAKGLSPRPFHSLEIERLVAEEEAYGKD